MIRDIAGYEGVYSVSDDGHVFGKRGEIKPYDNDRGYMVIDLYKNGKRKHHLLHRIVAEAFISNPEGLPQVNHKDENTHNNNVSNLEWCTLGYNINYGSGNSRRSETLKKYWERKRENGQKP